jgi:hypothetical protein
MTPRYGDNDWGDGCFRIPKNFYATVYSDTIGTVYGMLKPYYTWVMLYDQNDNEIRLNGIETESIGDYETVFVKTKQTTNSKYIWISWKNDKPKLFLSKTEMGNYKTEYFTYLDLICKDLKSLKNIPTSKMGVNLPMSCLNLREGPSTDFPIIACVPGNDHCNDYDGEIHINILDKEAIWVHVEAVAEIIDPKYKDEESADGPCPDLVVSRRIGWMKAVDISGFPNLWYAYPGY